MSYAHVTRCRCCGANSLVPVLDLGSQPLANSYTPAPARQPTYPLELHVCRECFHNQLSVVVDPDAMFKNYLYVSGTSRTLRTHFVGLAREALRWLGPGTRRVLDLACNDGTLLESFRAQGCEVTGVDPAVNLVDHARSKGLAVVEGYWPAVAPQVTGPFDLISACNVLAHVFDPVSFLKSALERLSDRGMLVVEFPYARDLIRHGEWDTIYHEHLSYFLAGPFLRLIERLGATVCNTHVLLVADHGLCGSRIV
jgi:SAM-dependent methyltransferase